MVHRARGGDFFIGAQIPYFSGRGKTKLVGDAACAASPIHASSLFHRVGGRDILSLLFLFTRLKIFFSFIYPRLSPPPTPFARFNQNGAASLVLTGFFGGGEILREDDFRFTEENESVQRASARALKLPRRSKSSRARLMGHAIIALLTICLFNLPRRRINVPFNFPGRASEKSGSLGNRIYTHTRTSHFRSILRDRSRLYGSKTQPF